MTCQPPPASGLDLATLESLLEVSPHATYALDTQGHLVLMNRAAEAYFGIERATVLGRHVWDIVPESRGGVFETNLTAAWGGTPSQWTTTSIVQPGRSVEVRMEPLATGGLAVFLRDLTEAERLDAEAREARRLSAQSAAELDVVLAQLAEGVIVADAEGRITFVNEAADRLHGQSLLDVPPDGYSAAYQLFTEAGDPYPTPELPLARAVLKGEVVVDNRWRIRRPDGSEVLAIGSARPIRSPEGRQIGSVLTVRDDTFRARAEEHLRLMVLELNHRVKNNLATVQAIARQTLRAPGDPASVREALMSRISALAAAHDVLSREHWEGASVREVAVAVLDALHEQTAGRVDYHGDPVRLSASAALSLSMAFHELGTNALKYGALSVPEGRLSLSWTHDVGSGLLSIRWVEQGGPPVIAPTTRGFGSRLLERGLAADLNGRVEMRFQPDGLECDIDVPVAPQVATPADPR